MLLVFTRLSSTSSFSLTCLPMLTPTTFGINASCRRFLHVSDSVISLGTGTITSRCALYKMCGTSYMESVSRGL